jgi:hypothetical protein
MLRFLADEDFDNRILKAFRRRESSLDWVRVQDIGLSGGDDEVVLQHAADDHRVVLTRDVSTMTAAALSRIEHSQAMPGLIVVPHGMAIGRVIEELIFLAQESAEDEWQGQIVWLPL